MCLNRGDSPTQVAHRAGAAARTGAVLLVLSLAAGCSLFGSNTSPALGPDGEVLEPGTEPVAGAAPDPFEPGVLKTVVSAAPAGSNSQYLAVLADEFGWEAEVNQDLILRRAVAAGAFPDRVEPRLLGLFFRQGFSVLPSVGEGHEFSRDTVVRGHVANRHFLVRAKRPVRIVFLEQADNIVIIYPKDSEQPLVFNRVESSSIAVRESRSNLYLN